MYAYNKHVRFENKTGGYVYINKSIRLQTA